MESPFEISIPSPLDSAPAPNAVSEPDGQVPSDTHRGRSLTRQAIKNRKVTTRWKKKRDILWQQNPDRVLKYRPSHLHYYGWIPFGIWQNVKATIFSEIYLHLQTVILLAWMGILQGTGLGVSNKDISAFVVMFSTSYLGAIYNYGMVVVFILGLFITLVINRWWSIRTAYAKLMGTTTDLCMVVASAVKNQEGADDQRIARARIEITRLLNLGHLLVIASADAQNDDFLKSYGLKTLGRNISLYLKKNQDILVGKNSETPGSPVLSHALSKPRNLTLEDLYDEGLLNQDEGDLLKESESEGMPAYHLVYYWTQALIHNCQASGWIISAPQMLPLILNKINTIVESGSQIITTINSQMPYPYVHLVSFVVHIYLFVLSTWFGCFLHTGQAGQIFKLDHERGADGATIDTDREVKNSVWIVFWCYFLMTVANVTFQGLLDMHTLLDNPFGNHCSKFPLRAHVGGVTNASRTMIMMAEKFPAAFGDVFQGMECSDIDESCKASTQLGKPSVQRSEFADFLHPTATSQFPLGSVGSWQTDKDRNRRHHMHAMVLREKILSQADVKNRIKQSRSQPLAKGKASSSPRSQFSTNLQTHDPSLNLYSKEENEISSQRLGAVSHQVDLEKRESLQSTGDPEIQEMFLQVAVEDAIQRSCHSLQKAQNPSSSSRQ